MSGEWGFAIISVFSGGLALIFLTLLLVLQRFGSSPVPKQPRSDGENVLAHRIQVRSLIPSVLGCLFALFPALLLPIAQSMKSIEHPRDSVHLLIIIWLSVALSALCLTYVTQKKDHFWMKE